MALYSLYKNINNTKNNTKNKSNSVASKNANYAKRIKAVGRNADDVTDKRNLLEKTLNLEEDQNVLFDIFEVLGRPQNALFSGIESVQNGGKFLEGAKEGITGENKVSGKDLLVNGGMDDTEGKLDLADVLGFGLDVFADPMDIIPVAGFGKMAKAIEAGEDISKAAKNLKTGSEVALNLAGKGIKKAAGVADKGIELGLKGVDKYSDYKLNKVANKTGETLDNIKKASGISESALDNYRNLKQGAKSLFNPRDNLKGLQGFAQDAEGRAALGEALAKDKATQLSTKTREIAEKIANETGGNTDDVYNYINEQIGRVIENTQDTSVTGERVLQQLSDNVREFKGTPEEMQELDSLLKNAGFKTDYNGGRKTLKVKGNKKDIGYLANNPEIQDMFKEFSYKEPFKQTAEQAKQLEDAQAFFNSNDDLKDLYKSLSGGTNDIGQTIGGATNTDFSDMTKEGYIRRAMTDEAKESHALRKNDMFSARKYRTADEGNAMAEAALKRRDKFQQQLDSMDNFTKEGAIESKQAKINELELKKSDKEIKVKENIKKAEEQGFAISKRLKNNESLISETKSKTAYFTNDKLQNIKDEALRANTTKAQSDYMRDVDKYNSLTKKLSNKNLSDKQIAEISNEIDKVSKSLHTNAKRYNSYMQSLDKKVYDNAISSIKKVNDATEKVAKQGGKATELKFKLEQNAEKVKELTQSLGDYKAGIDTQIKKLQREIEGIKNTSDEAFMLQLSKDKHNLEEAIKIIDSDEGITKFKNDYFAGLDDFIHYSTETSKNAQVYYEAWARGLFNDTSTVKLLESTSEKIPLTHTVVDGSVLSRKINGFKGILPEGSEALADIGKQFSGKKIVIDRQFANLLNVAGDANKGVAQASVKLVNDFNNMFKKFKTLTPGFHLRNIAGNATNMVLSGVPSSQIPGYYKKAAETLNNMPEIFSKFNKGGLDALSDVEKAQFDMIKQFYQGNFTKAGTKLQDLEDIRDATRGVGVIDKVGQKSMQLNEVVDSHNRMALLMYANEHPEYLSKLGVKSPVEAVKYTLMDPGNLTDFEKKYVKKLIPFYTFTKQNLLFHASNIMKNTPKYNRLVKAFNSIYDNLDENQYNQYQKEGFQLPLPIADDNGNQMFLKTNLPLSDLGEWASEPLRKALSSMTPLIKTPYEMVTGKDIYTGGDKYTPTLTDAYKNIKGEEAVGTTKSILGKAEQVLSGMGIDTISTNLIKKVNKAIETYNGDTDSQAMWAEIFRSVLQNTNQESIENSKAYESMEDYKNYISQLKSQGIDVPTVTELNKASRRSIRRINKRRNRVYK